MTDSEMRQREQMAWIGASLFQRGYTVGSSGNISARLEDGWLITPTDACLGKLNPLSIAKMDRAGKWVGGDRPSKTFDLHRGVYEANEKVNGIVHTHSTNLVALTLSGVWRDEAVLPPITPYQVMKVGRCPLIPYLRPGHSAAAEQVKALAGSVRAVLLERLGPVVWAESVERAAWALEELEETAKLWRLSDPKPSPLDAKALDDLAEAFGSKW